MSSLFSLDLSFSEYFQTFLSICCTNILIILQYQWNHILSAASNKLLLKLLVYTLQ